MRFWAIVLVLLVLALPVSAQSPVFSGTAGVDVPSVVVGVPVVGVPSASVSADWLRLGFNWVDYPCKTLLPSIDIPSYSVLGLGSSPSVSVPSFSVCPRVFDVDLRLFGWRFPLAAMLSVFALVSVVRWVRQ